MLQPGQNQQLVTARILWAALTFSTIIYGFVLLSVGKISALYFPQGDLSSFEFLAIAANFLAVITYFFHKDRVLPNRDFEKRFVGYILCWAINESIAVTGFIAVFIIDNGNGFFYLTNLSVALVANALTFPKQ